MGRMIYTTIKTVVLTIILITIIHLFIRYLLLNEKKKKKVNFNLENEIINDTTIYDKNDDNEDSIEDSKENSKEDSNNYDISNMKQQLMNYINSNKEIYSSDDKPPEPNPNCLNESKA